MGAPPSYGNHGYTNTQPRYQAPNYGYKQEWHPPPVPDSHWASASEEPAHYPPKPDEELRKSYSMPENLTQRKLKNFQKGYEDWAKSRAQTEDLVTDHVGWLTELRGQMTLRKYGERSQRRLNEDVSLLADALISPRKSTKTSVEKLI
mmetsp:Transcript_18010/g.22697  ORF Transcript_18010/g.22697 Transcript_18010/m.22697 type:complete len:148 (-) Transcript_18010:72-515(-)